MRRARSGVSVNAKMAATLGIDVDPERVSVGISQATAALTQSPASITIPKLMADGLFEAPLSFEELYTKKIPLRARPNSAPPVSREGGTQGSTAPRPRTAVRGGGSGEPAPECECFPQHTPHP